MEIEQLVSIVRSQIVEREAFVYMNEALTAVLEAKERKEAFEKAGAEAERQRLAALADLDKIKEQGKQAVKDAEVVKARAVERAEAEAKSKLQARLDASTKQEAESRDRLKAIEAAIKEQQLELSRQAGLLTEGQGKLAVLDAEIKEAEHEREHSQEKLAGVRKELAAIAASIK